MTFKTWCAVGACAAVLAACDSEDDGRTAGTDVGNPVVLALHVAGEGAADEVTDGAGTRFALTAARGQTSDVTLWPADAADCEAVGPLPGGVTCAADPVRLLVGGSVEADLITGTLSPEIRVPDIAYRQLILQAGPSDRGVGLVLSLTTAQGRDYRVEIGPTEQLTFEAREAGGFEVDLDRLVGDLDLQACAAGAPGQGPVRLRVSPSAGTCAGPTD